MTHMLITGASGGIGRALLKRLRDADADALLTVVGRPSERLEALRGHDGGIAVIATDLTTEAGAEQLATALATQPPLDGMAHLIGNLQLKPLHRLSYSEWQATLRIHLDSTFFALQIAVRRALETHHPLSVVLVSSVAAGLGLPNHEGIATAKAGLEGLVRSAAATYADKHIRVNAIAPALTETPLTAAIVAHEATRKAMIAQHPLGRLGTADDQAAAIAWLLSPDSSWITGQVLGVDGGMSRVRGRS